MDGFEWFLVIFIIVASIVRILTIQNWKNISPALATSMFDKNQIAKTWPMVAGSGVMLLSSLSFVIYVMIKSYSLRTISTTFKAIIILFGLASLGYDFFLSYILSFETDCSVKGNSVGQPGCEDDIKSKQTSGTIVSHVETLVRLIIIYYLANQFNVVQQIAGKRR
jgi:hypothetical protein